MQLVLVAAGIDDEGVGCLIPALRQLKMLQTIKLDFLYNDAVTFPVSMALREAVVTLPRARNVLVAFEGSDMPPCYGTIWKQPQPIENIHWQEWAVEWESYLGLAHVTHLPPQDEEGAFI